MIQGKKFIFPGTWFLMIYPSDWSEFEGGEGSFLFYNPELWTGNLRISAYKADAAAQGGMNYGKGSIRQELKENPSASLVKVGQLEHAYSREMFEEEGTYYTSHLQMAGIDNVAFECLFTVPEGERAEETEKIMSSPEVRKDGRKYPAEVIPIRLSEICQVNKAYEWTIDTVKTQLKKDFQGVEEDLKKIQEVIDSDVLSPKKKELQLAFGTAICTILANEVEGTEWMTLVDGNREVPVLRYKDAEHLIDPMKLLWSRVEARERCEVIEAYKKALAHQPHFIIYDYYDPLFASR